jgi:hypothetical protein
VAVVLRWDARRGEQRPCTAEQVLRAAPHAPALAGDAGPGVAPARAGQRSMRPQPSTLLSLPARGLRLRTGSQSWPKRMMTTRSSSLRIAWSTAYPESRCGNIYDMAAV